MMMFDVRCPVLRAPAPFRPAGFRGNDDTQEEAAGQTRRGKRQLRRLSEQKGKRS
jgi:hypothetical protein